MATGPAFATTPHIGAAITNAALDTSLGVAAPTNFATVFTVPVTRSVADGVTTLGSTTVTSATLAFTSADVGHQIGGVGIPPGTFIAGVTSATNAILSAAATATGAALTFTVFCLGARIDVVRINQVATSANTGYLNLFLFDGTTYHLNDVYFYNALTISNVAELSPVDLYYNSLVLAPGWSLRATVTTTGGQSAFKVTATGGDF